jgi:FKBP-type peptidyl-prolyl cis-trans isomerase
MKTTPGLAFLALTLLLPADGKAQPQQGVGADPAQSAVVPTSGASGPQVFPLYAYRAFGSSLGQSVRFSDLGWTQAQFNAFLEGIRASYQGKPFPMDEQAQRLAAEANRKIVEAAAREGQKAASMDPKERLQKYMKDMAKRLNLQISQSGLGYSVEAGGNGVRPRPGDTIVFTCKATGSDGVTAIPQLSTDRIRVKLEGMLPGLMEGLQMMTGGTQAVFVIPPELSFGTGSWPEGVPIGSPLVYWITLHEVIAAGTPP